MSPNQSVPKVSRSLCLVPISPLGDVTALETDKVNSPALCIILDSTFTSTMRFAIWASYLPWLNNFFSPAFAQILIKSPKTKQVLLYQSVFWCYNEVAETRYFIKKRGLAHR